MMRQLLPALTVLAISPSAHADAPEESKLGAELLYGQTDTGPQTDTLIGLVLQGDFLLTPGFALGGRLPVAHSRNDADDSTALGNLTIDLAYHLSFHGQGKSWLEGSFYLPTASASGDSGVTSSIFGGFWVPEPGLYLPDTTTLRALYNYRLGSWEQHLHVAAGADYRAVEDGDDRVVVPLVLGGRIALGSRAAALARFRTHWNLDAEDTVDDFHHTLRFGAELSQLGRGALTMLFYLPLDEEVDGWGLTFGYEAPL